MEPEDKKLREFLQDYAEILRTDVDISEGLPLVWEAKMAGGCIVIKDCRGLHIATISVEGERTSGSMPIGSVSTTFARLFVKLVNGWGEFCKNNPKE